MKILQINSVVGTGSTGRIVQDIYDMIESSGSKCLVAYGRGEAPSRLNTLKIGSRFSNFIHLVKSRLFDIQGLASVNATTSLIMSIKSYKPDVIHLHNIHGYYLNYQILFKYLKESKTPVVWTLHDCWSFTGHCAYFDLVNCNKWKTKCNKCPNKKQYPKSMLVDNSTSNYLLKKSLFTSLEKLTLVTPSEWLNNNIKQSFMKSVSNIVIYNGLNLSKFKPSEQNDFRDKKKISNKFMILGVANIWDERKGYDYFIKLSEMIDENSIIVMVGLSSIQMKKLPKSIVGIERTDSIEELVNIYHSADVFFNPTMEEMFGMVNIEALACGTPVVTFNSGGSPESINGSCGYVIDKGDLTAAISAFEKIKVGVFSTEDCIRRAQFFDNKIRVEEYLRLYKKVVDRI